MGTKKEMLMTKSFFEMLRPRENVEDLDMVPPPVEKNVNTSFYK